MKWIALFALIIAGCGHDRGNERQISGAEIGNCQSLCWYHGTIQRMETDAEWKCYCGDGSRFMYCRR